MLRPSALALVPQAYASAYRHLTNCAKFNCQYPFVQARGGREAAQLPVCHEPGGPGISSSVRAAVQGRGGETQVTAVQWFTRRSAAVRRATWWGYAVLALVLPAPSPGQVLLRWPIRGAPQPEVLLSGGAAALWNPAGLAASEGSPGQIWITHVDGPDATDLSGVAAAVTGSIPWLGRLGVAYQHLGVGDIPRTEDSPIATGVLNVGEDVVSVSLARIVQEGAAVGVAARYARAGHSARVEDQLTLDGGIVLSSGVAFTPRLAFMVAGIPEQPAWRGGLDVGPRGTAGRSWTARIAYGAADRFDRAGVEHRISLGSTWWTQLHAAVGLVRTAEDASWTGLWMLGADFPPYSIGVLGEQLPNDFGTAMYYRFAIELP